MQIAFVRAVSQSSVTHKLGLTFLIFFSLVAAQAQPQLDVSLDQWFSGQLKPSTAPLFAKQSTGITASKGDPDRQLEPKKPIQREKRASELVSSSEPWSPLSTFSSEGIAGHLRANADSKVSLTYADGTIEPVSGKASGFSKIALTNDVVKARLTRSVNNTRGLRTQLDGRGRVTSIEAEDLSDQGGNALEPDKKAERFLESNREILELDGTDDQAVLKNQSIDELGIRRFRYYQAYRGVTVYGQEASVYVAANGAVTGYRGHLRSTDKDIDVAPKLSLVLAKAVVARDLGVEAFTEHKSELQILPGEAALRDALTWKIDASTGLSNYWIYFIDASSGRIVKKVNGVLHGKLPGSGVDLKGVNQPITVWQEGTVYYLIDVTIPIDRSATANPIFRQNEPGHLTIADCKRKPVSPINCRVAVSSTSIGGWDSAAVSAAINLKSFTSYLLNTHGRRGIDDEGGRVFANVNDSERPDNASWNPGSRQITFGAGGTQFSNLAAAMDVAAHEVMHGVISATADLRYEGQSGALNESFADLFAVMATRKEWTIGSSIVKVFPGYLRNMADPHKGLRNGCRGISLEYAQPKHMSEYVEGLSVHCGSGIPNRAAYLIAEGLTREGKGESISLEATEKIYFYALKNLMHSSDQFLDARRALMRAASILYGSGSKAEVAVSTAFDQVGVLERTETPTTQTSSTYTDADPISGIPFLTYVDTNGWIYIEGSGGRVGPVNLVASTLTRPAFASLAVSSGILVYASKTGSARSINLVTGVDTLLTTGTFTAIAVDSGFRRMASTSQSDGRIFVYEFASGSSTFFPLLVPTPDAGDQDISATPYDLSFDYLGENLLFDYYIPVTTPGGTTYNRWSIGVLNLLTKKISVSSISSKDSFNYANPVFATNNRYIIAFDAWDSYNGESAIIVCNSNTQTCNLGPNPDLDGRNRGFLGNPAFNRDDSRMFYSTRGDPFNPYFVYLAPISKGGGEWTVSNFGSRFSQGLGGYYPTIYTLGPRAISSSFSISQSSIDFGQVALNTSGKSYLTLRNTGNVDVSILGLSFSDSAFSSPGVAGLIARGQSLVVPLVYSPGNVQGLKSGTLSITTNANVPVATVRLAATGVVSGQLPYQVDMRTYVPFAAAVGGYQSFVRFINLGDAPTPITVARIDGQTGAVQSLGQLLSVVPAGASITVTAKEVEAAMGVSLSAADRPRIRIGSNIPVRVQSFLLQPGGVFNEVSPAQGGSAFVVPTYIPAAAAPTGYQSYLRVINVGSVATSVTIARIDPSTGQYGAYSSLLSSLAPGAAVTFNATQVESVLGLTLPAAERPRMSLISSASTIEAQSFLTQPGGAFTNVSGSQTGKTVDVRTYVPAATVGYTSFIRIANSDVVSAPVSVSLIDGTTGIVGPSRTLIPNLLAGASTTLTSSAIEGALGITIPANDRPRIRLTSAAGLRVQSFLLQPGGAFNEVSGAQIGTAVPIRTYIPAIEASTGYSSYLRVINTGSVATPITVALIDANSGALGPAATLIASLPPQAAASFTPVEVEAALGRPIERGSRPRILINGNGTNLLEVQSFLTQPGGVFTEVSTGQ